MYSKTFLSSICKAILNTNSKPDTSPLSFFLILIKKFDSASHRPMNHSRKFGSIEGSDDTLWTPVAYETHLFKEFLLLPLKVGKKRE